MLRLLSLLCAAAAAAGARRPPPFLGLHRLLKPDESDGTRHRHALNY